MKKYNHIIFTIWILFIFIVIIGSLSSTISSPEKYHIDKIIHFFVYAYLAFSAYFFASSRKLFILWFLLIILIGGGIEIIQTFIPSRSGTIGDFAADFFGAIIGSYFAHILKKAIIPIPKPQ